MVEKKTLGKGTEQVIRKTIKELEKERGNSLPKEVQEGIIRNIEWVNSLDGIWEQINTLMTDTVHEDDKTKLVIAKTLLKLPYKVREKVLNDNVAFILSNYRGLFFELHFPILVRKSELEKINEEGDYIYQHKQPVIFLAFSPKTKEAEMMTTIAHEVAHFILDHKPQGVKGEKGYLIERKADDLCEKWGFGRAYKSYNTNLVSHL